MCKRLVWVIVGSTGRGGTRGGLRLPYGPDTCERREEEGLSTQNPPRVETVLARLMGNTQGNVSC